MNPSPRERELWDASYVNAPAVTELDDNSDGTRDRRLYATWDANFNITALVADHGRAVERYVWSPYGNDPEAHNGTAAYDGATLVLNGSESYTGSPDESYDWSVDGTGSDYGDFRLGFQGMRWDPDSKTFVTDTRRYLPSQGTFGGRDPLGTAYQDGMDLYEALRDNGQMYLDPIGEATFTGPMAMDIGWIEATNGQRLLNVASNGAPPSSFAPVGATSLNVWKTHKDYRDILNLQLIVDTDCDQRITNVTPIASQSVGYTNVLINVPGQGQLINKLSISSDKHSVTDVALAKFRVNPIENAFSTLAYDQWHGLAWAWAQITYTVSIDANGGGNADVSFFGSAVPSHSHYLDDKLVGGYSMASNPSGVNHFIYDSDFNTLGQPQH